MKTLFHLFDRLLSKCTPDPFVLAIFLTVLTIGLATWKTESTLVETVDFWGSGFWDLVGFTMQMAMILLGGYVVATSPPMKKLLTLLIGYVTTPVQAVLFCTLSAMLASWVNWGLGLVVGGVVAIEVGKRMPGVSYRVLVASSYSGFLVWHAGLSGSVPVALNTPDNHWQESLGGVIPLSETLFGTVNLVALGAMLILLPCLNLWYLKMSAVDGTVLDLPETELEFDHVEKSPDGEHGKTAASSWLENSRLVTAMLVIPGLIYLGNLICTGDFNLDLKSTPLILFIAGMLLTGTPGSFIRAVTEAMPKIAPILIQYPLYAGIAAVLTQSGLAAQIAEAFVAMSNKNTFPLLTFYSAGIINFLVPSGGGQWTIQAPVVIEAANTLGADIPKSVMAVAWGDAWTNMAQPFWALPLLAIAGLKVKDIIGFCVMTLIASGIVLSLVFLLVS